MNAKLNPIIAAKVETLAVVVGDEVNFWGVDNSVSNHSFSVFLQDDDHTLKIFLNGDLLPDTQTLRSLISDCIDGTVAVESTLGFELVTRVEIIGSTPGRVSHWDTERVSFDIIDETVAVLRYDRTGVDEIRPFGTALGGNPVRPVNFVR